MAKYCLRILDGASAGEEKCFWLIAMWADQSLNLTTIYDDQIFIFMLLPLFISTLNTWLELTSLYQKPLQEVKRKVILPRLHGK